MAETTTGTPDGSPYFDGDAARQAAADLNEFGYPDFVQEHAARALQAGYTDEERSAAAASNPDALQEGDER